MTMDLERLLVITEGLRAVVRKTQADTSVITESDGQTITLDAAKWKKFKKWFSIINTEFNLRYNFE